MRDWRRRDVLWLAAGTTAQLWWGRPGRALTTSAPAAASAPAAPPPPNSVVGGVLFDGKPPEPRTLDCRMDPFCARKFKDEPLLSEELVVAPHGGLQNVVVSVVAGLPEKQSWPVPPKPVVLAENCQFIPHVVIVRAGQPLELLNDSETAEVPHGYPKQCPEFSFSLPKKGMKKQITLSEPEVFRIKCDVHPWELAWCHVIAHPFYTVTDAHGQYCLPGLPPGEYQLEFWHEKLGTANALAKIQPGKVTQLDDVKLMLRKPRPKTPPKAPAGA